MDLTQIVALALTAVLALALGYLIGSLRGKSGGSDVAAASHKSELAGRDARLADGERQRRELQEEMARLRTQLDERGGALAAAQASLDAERKQSEEKLTLLESARDDLKRQFQILASEILEDKSKRFSELNKESMTAILTPLQTDITGFRQRVEEVYHNETKDRSALA